MKKLLLTLILAFSCTMISSAQFYVGGTFGISHSKLSFGEGVESQSGTSFKILPEIGYQLNDKFTVGGNIGYIKGYAALGSFDPTDIKEFGSAIASSITDVAGGDLIDMNLSAFRIAPYVRYSIYKIQKFEFFADGTIGLNFGKGSGILNMGSGGSTDVDEKMSSFEVSITPGVAFSVTDKLKLHAKIGAIGYQQLKVKDRDIKLSRFGIDVDGNNILFGLTYSL